MSGLQQNLLIFNQSRDSRPAHKNSIMARLENKPCELCGRTLKAIYPDKGATYYYPCACNRPIQTEEGVAYPGSEQHELILAGGQWNINDLLREVKYPPLQFNTENGFCQHNRTQGDNYGITCSDCGDAIAGYGFWGEGSKTCKHTWVKMSEESTEEICMYCQDYRPATPSTTGRLWQVGDLGRVKNNLVLLLEVNRVIWVSQGGDCGHLPVSQVEFIRPTPLRYRYVHWKEVIVDYFADKFTPYFTG